MTSRFLLFIFPLALAYGCVPADGEAPSVPCGFDPTWVHDPSGERLQLASTDGRTCIRLDRQDLSEPGLLYKARPYALRSVHAAHGEESWVISDEERLHWESTHHNWGDWATAQADDLLLHLDASFDANEGRHVYSLQALSLDERAVFWGPIELEPAAVIDPTAEAQAMSVQARGQGPSWPVGAHQGPR